MAEWFQTDTDTHFEDGCRFLYQQVACYRVSSRAFPWLIFATANLIQSSSVFFLRERSSTSLEVLSKTNAKRWISSHESGDFSNYTAFLDHPKQLLRKVDETGDLEKQYASSFEFERCFELRHLFVHFLPGSRSIELSGVAQIVCEACNFALDVCDTPGFFRLPRKWDIAADAARSVLNDTRVLIRGV